MGLDYDNSAFYYFSLTMLGMYAVPMTIWVVSYMYKAFKGQKRGTEVRGAHFRSRSGRAPRENGRRGARRTAARRSGRRSKSQRWR
jgi:hypothetical protein